MTLTIVRGIPGSGKSTYAKKLSGVVLETDMLTIVDGEYKFDLTLLNERHERCLSLTKTILEGGSDVVVANTFIHLKNIRAYVDAAIDIDPETFIEIVTIIGDFGSEHNVPDDVMSRMKVDLMKADIDNEFGDCAKICTIYNKP